MVGEMGEGLLVSCGPTRNLAILADPLHGRGVHEANFCIIQTNFLREEVFECTRFTDGEMESQKIIDLVQDFTAREEGASVRRPLL